jgi:DNA-binding CsgD family transcriptional regulator
MDAGIPVSEDPCSTPMSALFKQELFREAQNVLSEDLFEDGDGHGDANGHGDSAAHSPSAGVIVFSTSMELLYMNPAAWRMFQQANQALSGQSETAEISVSVMRLCHRLLKGLRTNGDSMSAHDRWLQYSSVVGVPQFPILFRGLVIPDQAGFERSRILILMDAIETWREAIAEAKERFNFTAREEDVVHHLLKGWTNKEIANTLGITEQTVKEHIKHVMQKTQTATRTGILVRVLGLMKPNGATALGEQVRALSAAS